MPEVRFKPKSQGSTGGVRFKPKADPNKETLAQQAAKYPSSQEQGRGGAGTDDPYPRVNAFMAELEGDTAGILQSLFTPEAWKAALYMSPDQMPAQGSPEALALEKEMPYGFLTPLIEQVRQGNYAGAAGKAAAIPAAAIVAGGAQGAARVPGTVGGGVRPLIQRGAKAVYESAMKPAPRSVGSPTEVNALIETGLKEGIPVSYSGSQKVERLINEINSQIDPIIDAGASRGDVIGKRSVVRELRPEIQRYMEQVNPTSDIGAIAESAREFMRTQPDFIPTDVAQRLKKGTYRALGERAYDTTQNPASTAAQKGLVRGLRKGLSEAYPEIEPLNAREGALLDFKPELDAAANRSANYNFFSPRKILDNPWVKSKVAQGLWRVGGGESAGSAVGSTSGSQARSPFSLPLPLPPTFVLPTPRENLLELARRMSRSRR